MSQEPIAIIGTGCRFPGNSDTPSKLWELLRNPRDLLRRPKAGYRFDPASVYHSDPEHHGTTNTNAFYFLDESPAEFDNGFFNIQPAESEAIDPQQRLLMETVYDSISAAGQTIEGLRGSSTAFVVGQMGDDWAQMKYKDWETLPQYTATGSGRSIVANRVSYFFDWHGPSINIDTACSSSLVAVHLAIQSLRNGECQVAVAAGANLILSPAMFMAESNLHMLSPTGRSRMWDKSADGYARGEGIAAIVLKPLSAAIRDHDHIECIIRATGVNQDGKTSGITMPNPAAQTSLIRETYARAGLDLSKPEDRPQMFHAHGTGTPAGDPKEAEAISCAFFSRGRLESETLYVGSMKTVVGHTEGAAGIASLVASSLAVQHGIIPPNLHFSELNPSILPFYDGLEVPTSAKPWPKLLPGQPRRASINSFGFGGTNAHAIIEAYEPPPRVPSTGPLFTPLTVSAANERSLRAMLSSYSDYLKSNPDVSLRDFAYTLQERRSTLAHRVSFAASTVEEAWQKMDGLLQSDEAPPELSKKHYAVPSPRILGVFTGQGAQWPGMGARLVESSPFMAKRVDELDATLASLPVGHRPQWTLREQLLANQDTSRVAEAEISQPLCTAVQILLVDLLCLAGISFHAVVGHSSGEIGAAYAAGLLTATGAIRIAYYRGLYAKLSKSPHGEDGAMMAVGASFEEASALCQQERFQGRVQVAARNSASSITLSGDKSAVAEAVDIFKAEGKFARQLKVDTAYHSAHMLPCAGPYLAAMEALDDVFVTEDTDDLRPTWYSSVIEGQVMNKGRLDVRYWVQNMTDTVLFAPAVTAAMKQSGSFDMALEIGPHPALKGPCLDTIEVVSGVRIPYTGVLSRGKEDVAELSTALGTLWSCLGAGSVSFERLEKGMSEDMAGRHIIPDLPKYPFDHSRSFWSMSRVSGAHAAARATPPHPLLGRRQLDRETSREIHWRNILRPKEVPWLNGHRIQGQIVFPAAGFIAMAVEAIIAVAEDSDVGLVTLEDLVIGRAIAFDDDNASVETLFSLKIVHTSHEKIQASFSCYSGRVDDAGTALGLNAEGSVTVMLDEPAADRLSFYEPEDWNMADLQGDVLYNALTKLGYMYTPPFRGLRSIRRKNGHAVGTLEDESGSSWEDDLLVHPGMLDTAFQASHPVFSSPGDGRLWGMFVPHGIKRISINPYFTCRGVGRQAVHPWEAVSRDDPAEYFVVDITLFSADNQHTFVQLEGLELQPLLAARPEDDVSMFSRFEYQVDRPNGPLAAPADEERTALDTANALVDERVAFYFVRRLVESISPDEWECLLPHYRHLMAWAARCVDLVKLGKNPSVPASYLSDTEGIISSLIDSSRHRVGTRLLEAVGKSLPEVVRAGSGMLDIMQQNGLSEYYDEGIGLSLENQYFAQMVSQVAHRYPKMNILEIGAGTGGSTRYLVPALGSSFSSYTYTDISSAFMAAAEERFQDYADRMAFKTFDMDQTPESQGFVENSYDLVVASNVLHVTADLEGMMANVRRLLKPGGHLINLEITSDCDDAMRIGLIMGCLPGWWVGADSGRPWSPALSIPRWDSLLRKSGFGGVDTHTPIISMHPVCIFAAQAVDDRVALLRSPLDTTCPYTNAPDLVILGGKTLECCHVADRLESLLASKFSAIRRVDVFEDLDEDILPDGCTVLSITELDEPLFKVMTPEKLSALQLLWRRAKSVLWVTRGARSQEPYSFMMTGLARVVKFEYPYIAIQAFDVDQIEDDTPHILAEEVVRLEILKRYEKEAAPGDQLVWSLEPEVYVESGKRLIPRLQQGKEANGRYNSFRRKVKKQVSPSHENLVFATGRNGNSYEIQQPSPLRLPAPLPATDTKEIRLSHILLQTIRVAPAGEFALCAGIDESTGDQLIAFSASTETPAIVPANWTVPLRGADPAEVLGSVAAYIVASRILALARPGSTILVHAPDRLVGSALTKLSSRTQTRVFITTSSRQQQGLTFDEAGWLLVNGNTSRRHIQKHIPASCSLFVNLAMVPGSSDAGKLIATCVPGKCSAYSASDFFSMNTGFEPGCPSDVVATTLQEASQWPKSQGKTRGGSTSTVLADNIPGFELFEKSLTVAVLTGPTILADVQPIDMGTIFREDRTYFMVGLTGDLGRSICQWMVEHGARYVVLTSRNPRPQPEFLRWTEERGATVKFLPLDITSRDSLHKCYWEIIRTMPPIAGVANAAMVLEDAPFDNMSFDAFKKVLDPKVVGTQLLDELFYETPLDFFIVFSSVTAVVANSGQSNYIAANMFMVALTAQRKKRGVAGSAIALSSVMGVGYVARHSDNLSSEYFERLGLRNMSEPDVHQLFAEAILAGRPGCPDNSEVVSGIVPFYGDAHVKALFREDMKFNHFVLERTGALAHGGKTSGAAPLRVQLADVKSRTEAAAIIRDTFVARLKRILLIPQDEAVDEKVSLVEQGIDSLTAVEARGWFMKELEVDMPVLKILAGSSISDLLSDAIERIPPSIIDLNVLADGSMVEVKSAEVQMEKPLTHVEPEASVVPPMLPSSPGIDGPEQSSSSSTVSSERDYHNSPAEARAHSDASVWSPLTEMEDPIPALNLGYDGHHDKKTSSKHDSAQLASFSDPVQVKMSQIVNQSHAEVSCKASKDQAQFLFLNDYLEDKTSQNMATMLKLVGKVDVSRLDKAVESVTQRHEALRTKYFWSGEGEERVAMQGVLQESSPIHLIKKRLESEADASRELSKMRSRVWDLGAWGTVTIQLLNVTEDIHFLLIGAHHIALDGFSFSTLLVDLDAAYAGRPLPPLGPESQPRALTATQEDAYAAGSMDKAIQELRNVIRDPKMEPIPLFPFSTTQTRPALDRYIQSEATAKLQPSLVSKLRQLARQNRSTIFHVYLAALQGLIHRLLPDLQDLFIGVPFSNRADERFAYTVGLLMNVVPLRFARDDKATVSELVKDARNKAYAAMQLAQVPWSVVLDELKIPRSNTHNPVYQVLVNYHQVVHERKDMVWGGCRVADEAAVVARTGDDVALDIMDSSAGESVLTLRLSAHLYDSAGAELLMRSLVNTLEVFAQKSDVEAGALPAYAPQEVQRALQIGKGPSIELEWPTTVSHRIDQMIEAHGDKIALKDGDGSELTYRQMGQRINTIAAALVAAGANDGSIVGVFGEPSADWICSQLAVFRVGATYVPLDLRNSTARLAAIVENVSPEIIITSHSTSSMLETIGGKDAAEILISDLGILGPDVPQLPNRASPDSTAAIFFTSGTTGKPKGIPFTHANVRAQSEGYQRLWPEGVKHPHTVLQQTGYGFDMSLEQTIAALAFGGTLVIVPATMRGDPRAITQMMADHGVTYTLATPSEYEMWFRYAPETLPACSSWRVAIAGGEFLDRRLIHQFADLGLGLPALRLFTNYGPTEVTFVAVKGEVKYDDPELEDHNPAGFVLPNYSIAILDRDLCPLPVGVAGEICVGGPGVSKGYLGLDEATRQQFVPGKAVHPSLADTGAWYRTGDRGRLRQDGAIYWLGRIAGDSQVKIRGFRIEVQEVEQALLKAANGAVSHAVVTMRGEGEKKFLAAHVVFDADFPHHQRQGVLEGLKSGLPLPTYMQPAVVVPIEDIPLSNNFKIDRTAIQALPLPETDTCVETMPGSSDTRQRLAKLWQKLIPQSIGKLTPDSNFFDVGGNSILLVNLQHLIQSHMSSRPRLFDLMRASTLEGMVKLIDACSDGRMIDWAAETAVPESLLKQEGRTPVAPRNGEPLSVILTGATGYLGRHLLTGLIDGPQISLVHCLVRDEKSTQVSQLASSSPKVELIRCDLSQPNLGLSPAAFRALAQRADVVVHCAANRSFFDSYQTLRPVNTAAVKDIARLALEAGAALHVVSSGAAASKYASTKPPADGSDGYLASKWAAETLLRNIASSTGLRVHIHSPSPVATPPASADVDPQSAPEGEEAQIAAAAQQMLGIARALGTRPEFSTVRGYVDLIPVDGMVGEMMSSITAAAAPYSFAADGSEMAGALDVLEHRGRVRVHVKDFASAVEADEDLRVLPTRDLLQWFGEAKRAAGFSYFMASHRLVMGSGVDRVVSSR